MSILLLEPESTPKRRYLFEKLTGSAPIVQPSLNETRTRLREIREYSLDHLDALQKSLTACLATRPEFEVTFARDSSQAIEAIQAISHNSRLAINKSTVIANELKPVLAAAGYAVLETYFDEFTAGENLTEEYWRLSSMPFEGRFQSFSRPFDLINLRSQSLRQNGAKDYVGLLGVNAIAAEDGSILFFQHMHNISRTFEQAREVILVAGLDKIVKNLDEAIFQTKCMATFGVEALPLTMPGHLSCHSGTERSEAKNLKAPGHNPIEKKFCVGDLPFEASFLSREKINLILLDNGRSKILKGPYRNLLSCIDCQACAKGCPTSEYFSSNGFRWSPRTYLYSFLTGKNPSLDMCLQCQSCEINCPLGIELPAKILEAKHEKNGKLSLTDRLMANAGALQSVGSSAAWLANSILGNKPLRWAGEKAFNISRLRRLPQYHSRTFARWFKSRRKSRD